MLGVRNSMAPSRTFVGEGAFCPSTTPAVAGGAVKSRIVTNVLGGLRRSVAPTTFCVARWLPHVTRMLGRRSLLPFSKHAVALTALTQRPSTHRGTWGLF